MQEKELIKAVIKKYENAQDISGDIPGAIRANLKRSNKHSVASFLEDAVGAFVADEMGNEYEIIVEQTFYFKNERSQFKPDVTIVKKANKTIVGFIEVKDSANPFRWQGARDENRSIKYVEDRKGRLERFRGNQLRYNGNCTYHVDTNARIELVLFSDRLFGQEKLNALESHCDGSFFKLHILLRGYHPNTKHSSVVGEELIKKIEEDQDSKIYSERSLRESLIVLKEK